MGFAPGAVNRSPSDKRCQSIGGSLSGWGLNREKYKLRREKNLALGICPNCAREPVAPNYATCARCRRRNQLTVDNRSQRLFDARIDYEDKLRRQGFRPWQEIADLLGFGQQYMYELMRSGRLLAQREFRCRAGGSVWWVAQKSYKKFIRQRGVKT